MCGGMVEVESIGDVGEPGLRGEGTRGRDHSTGLKTMGSKVGLRFAGRLLKSRGRTGNGARGMAREAGAGADWGAAGVDGDEEGIGTLKRGVIVRESFRTRGRSGGPGAGSGTGAGAGSAVGPSIGN